MLMKCLFLILLFIIKKKIKIKNIKKKKKKIKNIKKKKNKWEGEIIYLKQIKIKYYLIYNDSLLINRSWYEMKIKTLIINKLFY